MIELKRIANKKYAAMKDNQEVGIVYVEESGAFALFCKDAFLVVRSKDIDLIKHNISKMPAKSAII